MLKRNPKYLRVVKAAGTSGEWDALDQVTDSPSKDETVYAYEMAEHLGSAHINRGGGRGGFYPMSNYKLCADQPQDGQMRDRELWVAWCEWREAQLK